MKFFKVWFDSFLLWLIMKLLNLTWIKIKCQPYYNKEKFISTNILIKNDPETFKFLDHLKGRYITFEKIR